MVAMLVQIHDVRLQKHAVFAGPRGAGLQEAFQVLYIHVSAFCLVVSFLANIPKNIIFLQFRTPYKTSLPRRLQAQTLPAEAPPMGKIHKFSKIAATFEPVM